MGRKARISPNIRHSTPQNRLQMLVVNVNNSPKMPVWDIYDHILTHAHTNYPPVVPGCIIFSITHFTKDFDRKHFPSLTVAIKTTLQLRNKLPFLLSSSLPERNNSNDDNNNNNIFNQGKPISGSCYKWVPWATKE